VGEVGVGGWGGGVGAGGAGGGGGGGGGAFKMSADSVAAPLSSLPNKSCDAIVKWLRRRSSESKAGLVAFLLSHMWATLDTGTTKGAGVGVRMLLQLVARQDAGAIADNLTTLPIDGIAALHTGDASLKRTTVSAEAAKHPLSRRTVVWVLKQLAGSARTARTAVFHGWWAYLLPLLCRKQQQGQDQFAMVLSLSLEVFGGAEWEKLSLNRDAGETKPEKGGGMAAWMIAPAALKQLLLLGHSGGGGAGAAAQGQQLAALRQQTLGLCHRFGHSTGLFGPALFAQLLPLLNQGGTKGAAAAEAGAAAANLAMPLLLECLVAGGTKIYQNWVAAHTSPKAANFSGSLRLLGYLAGAASPQARRQRLDRGRFVATMAELKVFHATKLEQANREPWGELRLLSGKRFLEVLEADPAGTRTSAGESALSCLLGVVQLLMLLAFLLPVGVALALNVPALKPEVARLRMQSAEVDQLLRLGAQLQKELLEALEGGG
jgi:hypothetical protein